MIVVLYPVSKLHLLRWVGLYVSVGVCVSQ